MKHSSKLLLSLAATTLAFAAHAGSGVKATDVPRISNGGTGVIGGPDHPGTASRTAQPMTHGMGVAAKPQAQVQAQAQTTDTTAMGASAATTSMGAGRWSVPSIATPSNPSWGTPF